LVLSGSLRMVMLAMMAMIAMMAVIAQELRLPAFG
jgi:hypothetical protein